MTRTVAAIDCGTNSTRLLVARDTGDGRFETLERLMTITRLGEGVDGLIENVSGFGATGITMGGLSLQAYVTFGVLHLHVFKKFPTF